MDSIRRRHWTKIQDAFKRIVKEAGENNLSLEGQETLYQLLQNYKDVFRIRVGQDPRDLFGPMNIVIKPKSIAHVTKARRYTPYQPNFIRTFIQKMADYGLCTQNITACWGSAHLLVQKPPPANFRLTFNLWRLNSASVPTSWPMPHIESELMDLEGSKCFAFCDLSSEYWQLPFHQDSQEYHSFLTQSGIIPDCVRKLWYSW